MIFRQFFEPSSCTYTYLIADPNGEALLIDPVDTEVSQYLRFISELNLKLVFSVDTHVHADHITGSGLLKKQSHCTTVLGQETQAQCVDLRIKDGDTLKVGTQKIKALSTPGHTQDSYSFLYADKVFTGDTLLIRGTGRTDFQSGSADMQYDSIFNRLLSLPEDTQVYPGHDYKGWTVSTIGEEKRHNPRLQVKTKAAYIEIMNNLNLPYPKMMDVAVPANLMCGLPSIKESK